MSGELLAFPRQLQLVVVQCCTCSIEYGIPQILNDQLLLKRAKGSTTCPNGHGWHYTGKSADQRAQEAEARAREAEHRVELLEQQVRDVAAHAEGLRRPEPKRQGKRGKRSPYETSRPRQACPVCGQAFIRLATHQTKAKHWPSLKAVN